jgi:hypothetical protein
MTGPSASPQQIYTPSNSVTPALFTLGITLCTLDPVVEEGTDVKIALTVAELADLGGLADRPAPEGGISAVD